MLIFLFQQKDFENKTKIARALGMKKVQCAFKICCAHDDKFKIDFISRIICEYETRNFSSFHLGEILIEWLYHFDFLKSSCPRIRLSTTFKIWLMHFH